jgi:hypothetical protein
MNKITIEVEVTNNIITPTELQPFLVNNTQEFIQKFIFDKINNDYTKLAGQSLFKVKTSIEEDITRELNSNVFNKFGSKGR